MLYAVAADAVVVAHGLFIVFAALGALAVLRWPWVAAAHLPALAWAVWIEATHGICPLTPLEVSLRRMAGEHGYAGGFIDHYLMPLIYPPGLTPQHQVAIAVVLVAFNALLYVWALLRRMKRR